MKRSSVVQGGGLMVLVVATILYFVVPQAEETVELRPIVEVDTVETYTPTVYYNVVIDSLEVMEGKIKRNQNLAEILAPYNVSNETIHRVAKESKKVFDVRKLVIGKPYSVVYSNDSLKRGTHFIYRPNAIDYVVYDFQDSIQVYKKEKPVDIVEKSLSGVINSSLYETMVESGAGPELVDMMVDVFAWQVDFFGIRKGDNFKLIYEEKSVEQEAVGIHRIAGAYFEHHGEKYYAINFDQGKGLDYFDTAGVSLRRNLLKAPLNFTRISSRYSGRRFHPVQKRYKAHRGTDYAAPTGTPIRTVGDGVVLEARYHKYNGNYVKIKHNDNISTQYLHMSKIKKGIRKGVRVKQGQNIGFVGKTGLANGPHLCYRFWKNGVQVDALKVDLPPSEPILDSNRVQFNTIQEVITTRLDSISFPKEARKEVFASMN